MAHCSGSECAQHTHTWLQSSGEIQLNAKWHTVRTASYFMALFQNCVQNISVRLSSGTRHISLCHLLPSLIFSPHRLCYLIHAATLQRQLKAKETALQSSELYSLQSETSGIRSAKVSSVCVGSKPNICTCQKFILDMKVNVRNFGHN